MQDLLCVFASFRSCCGTYCLHEGKRLQAIMLCSCVRGLYMSRPDGEGARAALEKCCLLLFACSLATLRQRQCRTNESTPALCCSKCSVKMTVRDRQELKMSVLPASSTFNAAWANALSRDSIWMGANSRFSPETATIP